jgi:hypothetical protein
MIFLDDNLDIVSQEEVDQIGNRDLSSYYSNKYRVLYFKESLWILNDEVLKKKVLESEHYPKIIGYIVLDTTLKII